MESITAALGIAGWQHLDHVVVAALALEAPVLLVGEHGTGKSLVVERVAAALGQSFRHYNASLLNYDDLLGIPMPDGDDLRFVGTKGAIWGAQFAFFDEVNRCRPDLQNKLFPIVHERRIAGADLADLRHRWAAMNPPSEPDEFGGASGPYAGAEELDAALADRFWFVVPVPGWSDLTGAERHALVDGMPRRPGPWLTDAVARVRDALPAMDRRFGETLTTWAVSVVNGLRSAQVELSPRRAAVLRKTAAALHATASVTASTRTLEQSAGLALQYGVPQQAAAGGVSLLKLTAAHRQAWAVAERSLPPAWQAIMSEPDLVKRVKVAKDCGVSVEELSECVTHALSAQPTHARSLAVGLVFDQALRTTRLTSAARDLIKALIEQVHADQDAAPCDAAVSTRDFTAWSFAQSFARSDARRSPQARMERSLLLACSAQALAGESVDSLTTFLIETCRVFGVRW